jgi:hypothetical protein
VPEGVTTIATFMRLEQAVVARTVLESAGIECFLADENMARIVGPYQAAAGGIRLQVLDSEAEAALELLRTQTPGDPEQEREAE